MKMKVPNIPLLQKLAHLIEEILKAEAPVAKDVALKTVEADPKVQAVTTAATAMYQAAQALKAASAAASEDVPDAPVSEK